ncbi:MAG: S9 family peptidase [Armatimonadetes bacterium]|nr:S9 family peptidase [Armatimonadota bacterium]
MAKTYQHLGEFSDLVAAAERSHSPWPIASPGRATQRRLRSVLNFAPGKEQPLEVRLQRRWEKDGVAGEEISWSVGYGPRTTTWLLRPARVNGKLPGVVALHHHGGFKFYGKEQIADGPDATPEALVASRGSLYGGRAYANELARRGFAVLVPDVFGWGSRKFALETIPENLRNRAQTLRRAGRPDAPPDPIAEYNAAAGLHEELVQKYCQALGTSIAGVASYEDRIAVNYLASRADIRPDAIGCVGLSGGGLRAALLQATSPRIKAAVVASMMSTYRGLLDHNIISHTWMLYPPGWANYGDLPDIAACRAPSPLLVQYSLDDALFTVEGMRAADARITQHYATAGSPKNYTGQFFSGPHQFDIAMQEAAFAWLAQRLRT